MNIPVARGGLLVLGFVVAACSSTPPPPDWKLNAVSQIEHFQQSWLEGDSKAAALALDQARGQVSRSGRIDLLARAELAACATRAAALDFSPCTAYRVWAGEADARDVAYARFLEGDWNGLDAQFLPAQYADLVRAKEDPLANRAVAEIREPLPRLIAAALLFKRGRAQPATLTTAIDTASDRGWRRPLLAWLQVALKRAQAVGDTRAAARLLARIDLIGGKPAGI